MGIGKKRFLLFTTLAIILIIFKAGLISAADCWLYSNNETACNLQAGKCEWKSSNNNSWCEQIGCWSFNGNQSGCNHAINSLGLLCSWSANNLNQNPWCPIKQMGDMTPYGVISNSSDIGCCEMQGCWSRDGTNDSYCQASDFFNGICEWHHKNASNPLNYDPYCQNPTGCCVVPPCQMFNGNQTKCNTAVSLGFNCIWNNDSSSCNGGGCEQYDNDQEQCLNHGCSYNPLTQDCMPPAGGGGGGGIGGAEHCWFADNSQNVCMNITGCVYCTDSNSLIEAQLGGGNISNNQSFCYNKQAGYCEGHQSDASGIEVTQNKTIFNVSLALDNIECLDVKIRQACDCGPFPMCKWSNSSALTGNYCEKINRTKTDDEMVSCRPKIGNDEVKFCEDPKITNEENCSWLTTNFNMPCKWDSPSGKCKFASESVFKGGPIGDMWEIDNTNGGETACLAAKGVWKSEYYIDDDGSIKQDSFCEMGTTESGLMIETCDSFCGACEWYFSDGTVVDSLSDAQQACNGSSLGFCQFQLNSNAPNKYGFCEPPPEFKFGGGDCKTDCKSCGIVSADINAQQQACQSSPAGCIWVNSTIGGYCQSSSKTSCSSDCMACIAQQDCLNSPLKCEWDSSYYYCKAQGFTGEVCFDTIDNDGDGKTDCSDSDCVFNQFCGGTVLADCGKYSSSINCSAATVTLGTNTLNCSWVFDMWSNSSRCMNPGEQCWMHEDNQTRCANAQGCKWTNFTAIGQPEEAWCDVRLSIGKSCNGLNTTQCALNENCVWNDFDGSGPAPGFCDFFIFNECGNLTSQESCSANNNCTWSTQQFMGMQGGTAGGHCEPACFNDSLTSNQCSQKSFCEWKETVCEPSFMADCADYDGNRTGCEQQPMCQWYPNENLCDPKMGGQIFQNAGFGGGGGGGGSMPMSNDAMHSMEFFHLGDDSPDRDWTYPSGWTQNQSNNDTLEALDIRYFGIKDLGNEYGFGIGVTQTVKAAFCNGKPTHWPDSSQNNTGTAITKFYWYLDTSGNEIDGCNATDQYGTLLRGFEFLITLYSAWDSQENKSVDTKTFFRCDDGAWTPTSIALYMDKIIACQIVGGAAIAIEKESFEKFPQQYNSTATMRIFIATGNNNTFIADSAGPGYFKHGTVDFKPECCLCPGDPDMDGDGKPASTDEECAFIKQKGFMSFEDCFNGKDDNNDGATDCQDNLCKPMPKCGGQFNFVADANDKTAPTVIFQKVDEWADSALIKFDTDEPANGEVKFYYADSSCIAKNKSLYDFGDPNSDFDDYKPFHTVTLDQKSLGYALNLSTAYYYKIRVCDPSGNCGESACLNFTTKSGSKKVLFAVNLDPGYVVDFECAGYNKTNWDGEYAIKVNTSYTRNCNLTIKCNNGNYHMELVGVDITSPQDIDLQSKLVCEPANKMIGMDSENETWHEVLYDLGMGGSGDYIEEEYPYGYNANNELYHCNEGNLSDCEDISDYVSCTGNASNTYCKIPTSVGYSAHQLYVASGGTVPPPSSGGGGGGGGAAGSTYSITENQFIQGYSNELAANDRIQFTISNEIHSVIVASLKENEIMVNVSSITQRAAISLGGEAKFDLTDDKIYDLSVKYNNYNTTSKKAQITVKRISEIISEEKPPAPGVTGKAVEESKAQEKEESVLIHEIGTQSKKVYTIIILAVLAVIIVIITFIVVYRKKRAI